MIAGHAVEVYDAKTSDEVVSITALCAALIQAAQQERQSNYIEESAAARWAAAAREEAHG